MGHGHAPGLANGLLPAGHADAAPMRRLPDVPVTGTSGLMGGMWKWILLGLGRHPQTKGRATARLNLNHRATSRLYHRLRCVAGMALA
jgi:hypothetical protein